jgi:hypothetical protein
MVFKRFDVFPKFSDESVHLRTISGGIISLIMMCWVSFLVFGQIITEFNPTIDSSLILDADPISGPRKVYIDFDLSVDSSCTSLHLDLFETDGVVKSDIIENVTRQRLDEFGTPIEIAMERHYKDKVQPVQSNRTGSCGSCYGALPAEECCYSCYDVMTAFRKKGWSFFGADRWEQCIREGYINFGKEKCRWTASLKVKRGSGHFHIGLGANNIGTSKGHQHDTSRISPNASLSHHIAKFEVGAALPDFIPPLNDVNVRIDEQLSAITYYLHIVPSRFEGVDSFRYSVMYSQRALKETSKRGIPGIQFFYDFSPMTVVTSVRSPSLKNLMIHTAGIVGGAFSFAAIIDALMFGALSTIEGKRSIGKDL